jgi:probable HAF family extracellular repeat protein
MTDLNDLLPNGSGWTLAEATAINNSGQVVGVGVHNGQNHAFLLTPFDIKIDSIRTTDSQEITVSYDINTIDLADKSFQIGIFQCPMQTFDKQDYHLIDSIDISGANAKEGHHTVADYLPFGIAPTFSVMTGKLYHYVDAVADPDGVLQGFTIDNSQGYFHQYVIGAVSVGYKPFEIIPDGWVKPMADSLQATGYDGVVIPFARWHSGKKDPTKIVAAGDKLAALVMDQVDGLAGLKPNDVIDVHLIGHSRGSVVISEAMTELLADDPLAQLQHGYFKMTLLDPHPANSKYGLNADFDPGTLGSLFQKKYVKFQDAVHDPDVVVPARVNKVEILWEQTPVSELSGYEGYINLWGLDPSFIQFQGSQTAVDKLDLTGKPWGNSHVGHTEVHDWYQKYYIPGGGAPPLDDSYSGGRNGVVPSADFLPPNAGSSGLVLTWPVLPSEDLLSVAPVFSGTVVTVTSAPLASGHEDRSDSVPAGPQQASLLAALIVSCDVPWSTSSGESSRSVPLSPASRQDSLDLGLLDLYWESSSFGLDVLSR